MIIKNIDYQFLVIFLDGAEKGGTVPPESAEHPDPRPGINAPMIGIRTIAHCLSLAYGPCGKTLGPKHRGSSKIVYTASCAAEFASDRRKSAFRLIRDNCQSNIPS
jgi:hypothetical protein